MNASIEGAHAIARALQEHLQRSLADPMTSIDLREGEASGAMWARVGGAEYFIMVKPSARQQAQDRRKAH